MTGNLEKEERNIKISREKIPYKIYLGEVYAFIISGLVPALIYLCDVKIYD